MFIVELIIKIMSKTLLSRGNVFNYLCSYVGIIK